MQIYRNDNKKLDVQKLNRILKEKQVIGMWDSWENIKGKDALAPEIFKTEMQRNDIVLIRDGKTPVALVKVEGTSYVETSTNEDFDWFTLRRPISVLKTFGSKDEVLLKTILDNYGSNHIQAPGTLTHCDGNNATNEFIKQWHLHIQNEQVMGKIKLSKARKKNIKDLWESYKNENGNKSVHNIQKEIESLQDDWKAYREKISRDKLSLDDYTNRLGNESANLSGGYLCNFLERETRLIYGSSKPGNASNFEVKLNEDGETYTFREDPKRKGNHSREEADKRFIDSILPVLQKIVNASSVIEKIEHVESANYAAKQILRKMAVLDDQKDFLYIYSDDAIDTLHNEFLDSETETNLGKNHEIRLVVNEILNLDNTALNAVLVSKFLYKYATSKAIADASTPNVILYGPPGTGKTYTVKQSLKFVCMGDTDRYEIVTFHPSFTYEDFIDGIKPKGVTNDGNIKFELVDGVFKKFCKKAKAECEMAKAESREAKPFYFVVDEINRANLSAVFGETLVCLEKDYRYNISNPSENLYKTQYSALMESMISDAKKGGRDMPSIAFEYQNEGAYFGVPNNLFFIGMMNDVDKSIDAFDLALRRRFKWIRMDYDPDVLEQETKFRNGSDFKNIEKYANACTDLNKYVSQTLGLGKSYEFGHSFFMKISGIANSKTISETNMEVLFQLYLKPSLREYLRAIFPEQELDGKLDEALTIFKSKLR